ncbi:DEAD/DEAH box helicase [Niallia taxi]|uniref:DEAD/DEAH box helicase n=1 Tax=Niallia taxi TaxID=2499688 RepID=UPI00317943F2
MNKLNLNWVSETIGNEYKKWKKGDTVLISAQTGTGKTFFIMNSLLDNLPTGDRLLYVCNRTNLKRQLKKDLLKKFNQEIPDTLNELDHITTIADKITITSYHAISNSIKDSIYLDDVNSDLSLYNYIVLDECHFIFSDGNFNNKTRFAYEKLIKEWHPNKTRIFISATMDEIRDPIIRCVNNFKTKGFCLDNFDIHEYSTGTDYSNLDVKYFDKIKTIVNLIKNDSSDEKWLVFISNINRDGMYIVEELGESSCSIIKSGTESDELNSIINNSKFTKKVLICTKALDNGININDPLLKNIVIMAWDKISFIQMLGRKRIDINKPDDINLFIPKRYKKSFFSRLMILNNKKSQIELLGKNENEFYRQYDNDLHIFKDYNDIFYRDFKSGKIKVNSTGYKRLNTDIFFNEYMIDQYNELGEYAFIMEQLSWLGLADSFDESNMIEEVTLKEEIETLEEYLNSLVGIKLFKDEQNELIDKIELKDSRGRLQKSINQFNAYFEANNMNYMVISKSSSKLIEGKKKNYRYWLVINNVEY